MGWYNGYSPAEREAKLREMARLRRRGEYTPLEGPCSLCADPHAPIEPHTEDYSQPYLWSPPAEFPLCRACHRTHIHKRFSNPLRWEAFKAHVSGGYARDLKAPEVQREFKAFLHAAARGETIALRCLRDRALDGAEWWELLTCDPAALTSVSARPRP